MFRRRANAINVEETDRFIHDIVIFIADLLKDGSQFTVDEVTENVKKRGNLKPLKRIASGETLEARMQVFLWQHPTIFTVDGKMVSLTAMSPDLDEKMVESREQRALEYLVFRIEQYGFMQVLIFTLFGHLHHSAPDIKSYFNNNFNLFFSFVESHRNEFVLSDNYVSLKQVYEESQRESKLLPKSDVYLLDSRVLQTTQTVVRNEDGKQIVDYILRTQSVVAIDCEGVNLGAKTGFITLIQLAFPDCRLTVPDITPYIRIYLFDIQANRALIPSCLKRLLQDKSVMKIFQGCSADSTSLYMKHRIQLENVFDTVIAHRYLSSGGKADLYSLYEIYVGEQANRMKKDIKKQYIGNPRLWATRPLTEELTYYAAFDVYSLLRVYFAMLPKISAEGLEHVKRKSIKASNSAVQRAKPDCGTYPRRTNDSTSTGSSLTYQNYPHSKANYGGPDYSQDNVWFNGYHVQPEPRSNYYPSSSRGSHQNWRYNDYHSKHSMSRHSGQWNPYEDQSSSYAPLRGSYNHRGSYRPDDSRRRYPKRSDYYRGNTQ